MQAGGQHLLQLCDALFFLPASSCATAAASWDSAALGRLTQLLEQQPALLQQLLVEGAVAGETAPTGAQQVLAEALFGSGDGHLPPLANGQAVHQPAGEPLQPGQQPREQPQQSQQQPSQQQQPQQPSQQPSGFDSLLAPQLQQPSQVQEQQASQLLFMSQADDNTGLAAAAGPLRPGGSQDEEAAEAGLTLGVQASQPDLMQQEALLGEQQLQRELLERRQQQHERRQQQREEEQRRQDQQSLAADRWRQQQELELPPQQREQQQDRRRQLRLAGASEATYHLVWRLLGTLAALPVARPLDGMACSTCKTTHMHVSHHCCCYYPPSFLQAGCLAACFSSCSRRSPRGGAPPNSSRRPAAAELGPCCACRHRWRRCGSQLQET